MLGLQPAYQCSALLGEVDPDRPAIFRARLAHIQAFGLQPDRLVMAPEVTTTTWSNGPAVGPRAARLGGRCTDGTGSYVPSPVLVPLLRDCAERRKFLLNTGLTLT
ncbi:hypothetical protein LTT66_13490 [Nocardia gipuzkoensis]|uniref:hypothetical protein n=1 Tax=Nocardia gipuzkoensis TaxID=2749991 RepID=UPI001E4E9752|nr:hypothetical protein [Nocardia gipuzkoensis]UGT71079.1 hypothetical protein LTT66_13490 [Nocardia gipuzkoensis]